MDKNKITMGDIVKDGDSLYPIETERQASIANRPRMSHIKMEGITTSKALQEKREIWKFIMNNAGQNIKTKLFTVLLDESEIEELKKLCGVEE